jgi:hypothetical protein
VWGSESQHPSRLGVAASIPVPSGGGSLAEKGRRGTAMLAACLTIHVPHHRLGEECGPVGRQGLPGPLRQATVRGRSCCAGCSSGWRRRAWTCETARFRGIFSLRILVYCTTAGLALRLQRRMVRSEPRGPRARAAQSPRCFAGVPRRATVRRIGCAALVPGDYRILDLLGDSREGALRWAVQHLKYRPGNPARQ